MSRKLPSGEMKSGTVRSSPPVSCTGNRCGPSRRHTCRVPVTVQLKKSRFPSEETKPVPGDRTSNRAWMRLLTLEGMAGGANFASTSGDTLPSPCPE